MNFINTYSSSRPTLAAKSEPTATSQNNAFSIGESTLSAVVAARGVIRSDDIVSGYRWGAERKRELINREAAT